MRTRSDPVRMSWWCGSIAIRRPAEFLIAPIVPGWAANPSTVSRRSPKLVMLAAYAR